MKSILTAMCAASLALGVAACSGDPGTKTEATEAASLAGTWKANLDSAEFENSTSSYLFADGQYTCNSCIPPYTVAANGEWVSVDRPGVDAVKYTIVDDRTITAASRLGDKELGIDRGMVSASDLLSRYPWSGV